jgi:hypothetical protein
MLMDNTDLGPPLGSPQLVVMARRVLQGERLEKWMGGRSGGRAAGRGGARTLGKMIKRVVSVASRYLRNSTI